MDDEKKAIIENRLAKLFETNKELEQKLTRDLRKNFINCLLDGTVYSIVDSLKDLQHIREKYK